MAAIVLGAVLNNPLGYCIAAVLAIAFLIAWWLSKSEDEVEFSGSSLFAGVIPDSHPRAELGSAYDREVIEAIVGRPAAPTITTRDWPGDWKELEGRFRQCAKSGVYAEFFQEAPGGTEHWTILAPSRPADGSDCRSLCKLAGRLLVKSPGVSRSLSIDLRSEPDDVLRWLYFLKGNNGLTNIINGNRIDHGEVVATSVTGRIMDLANMSARACIECAANAFPD
jgi:hypothetical protein